MIMDGKLEDDKRIDDESMQQVTGGIEISENESLETALRRFKRKNSHDNAIGEPRKREHYEKPSARRKKTAEAARKRKY